MHSIPTFYLFIHSFIHFSFHFIHSFTHFMRLFISCIHLFAHLFILFIELFVPAKAFRFPLLSPVVSSHYRRSFLPAKTLQTQTRYKAAPIFRPVLRLQKLHGLDRVKFRFTRPIANSFNSDKIMKNSVVRCSEGFVWRRLCFIEVNYLFPCLS